MSPVEKWMLPVDSYRNEIIDSITNNQVVIVVGETGSGKTTGLPRFMYQAGMGNADRKIGITEPRRIAAISVAEYLRSQMDLTDMTIGHKVRFTNETAASTVLKFMTDGILLQEMHHDPLLSQYGTIMIDEAHERSMNIDFLMGLVKRILPQRPDLRLIIASATIDAGKFSHYFHHAPVFTIEGRTHDVEIVWGDRISHNSKDRVARVAKTVQKVHFSNTDGDVLVFLPDMAEITQASEALAEQAGLSDIVVLPAHGALPPEEQAKIFHRYPGKRKVILATNIAETSLTVDGVKYVIDTGVIKQRRHNPTSGMPSLDIVPHSKAGCDQRTGRAGRTQPGICHRLYSKTDYAGFQDFTVPEIMRTSLAGIALSMESLEIPDVEQFDFIDPPNARAFHEAYETLKVLGAINPIYNTLTDTGKEMARLPLDPVVSRMVIESQKFGCVEEIATIAAFISLAQSVFVRPQDKQYDADCAHALFKDKTSDALTFLKVWAEYTRYEMSNAWCVHYFIAPKRMREVANIRGQILRILERQGVEITTSTETSAVLRCVAAGLIHNLLQKGGGYAYDGMLKPTLQEIFIHPSSSVFRNNPEFMVSHDIVRTTKRYARLCSGVEPGWLPQLAPEQFSFGEPEHLVKYSWGDDKAVAQCPVRYRDPQGHTVNVGSGLADVSLDDAYAIQRSAIDRARYSGWIRVRITERNESEYYDRTFYCKSDDGRRYELYASQSQDVNIGDVWYCEVSFMDMVRPRFQEYCLERRLMANVRVG